MKKFIVLIIVLIIFSLTFLVGCSDIYNQIADAEYYDRYCNVELYGEIKPSKSINYYHIAWFINRFIRYEKDVADYAKSPKETFESGSGDCEDIAILFMNIAYFSLNKKLDLVLVNTIDYRKIEDGGIINHAMVRDENGVIDPLTGFYVDVNVRYSYSFDTVFNY